MDEYEYSERVSRLIDVGLPKDPWPDYPAEYGLTKEHIPELIRMAADERIWEEDPEDAAVYRNVHAWRALGQLQAQEALPDLLGLLRWADDYDDEWVSEDLTRAIALLGPDAIRPLSDYLADPQNGEWARISVLDALEEIGKRFPETTLEAARAVARTLAVYEQNDPELNGFLVTALAHMKQPETYGLVKQAFESEMVEEFIMGDWEDFQVKVGLLEKRLTPEKHAGLGPFSSGALAGRSAHKEEKKAKAKRKMEKQSRKKNRKKKK